jgi:hypothetical protein
LWQRNPEAMPISDPSAEKAQEACASFATTVRAYIIELKPTDHPLAVEQ